LKYTKQFLAHNRKSGIKGNLSPTIACQAMGCNALDAMNQERTRIKLLDSIAISLQIEGSPNRSSGLYVIWCALLCFGETLFQKYWVVGLVIALFAAAATAMVWFHHRYGGLATSTVTFAIGAALAALTVPNRQHIVPNLWPYGFAMLLIFSAFFGWYQFARQQSKEWQKERPRVEKWLTLLRKTDVPRNIVQIQQRSFVRGYFTYRFLNTGDCWAMATFKIGKENKFPEAFRIRELSAITIENELDGAKKAAVDGRAITNSKE
jgi:hypothetical protein